MWGGVAALLAACGGGEGSARAPRETAAASVPAGAGASSAPGVANGPTAAGRSVNSTGGRPTVVFMGTSLTAGYGLDGPAQAYPALLQRRADSLGLAVRVVNAGLSGETSAGALRRVDWVLRGQVDAFVLETGANDGLRALDVDATRANIVAAIRRVRALRPSARVYLVQMEAPPNLGPDYTARFRAVYPAVAKAEGVTLLPFLLEDVAGRPAFNQPDGMHPTAEGAERVARTLWPALEPLFRQLDALGERA
ncbi:MAG: Arylesterase precursor [uncultured Gemmatimonadaceae bacterium]|uniref:Arylesterase n=1 Tax=uncultured Gemmatimonadaceae bacterium TaxID=246130 RepID=A0A6J4K275_9BACT|nr:MAG: Arylesterase precursor [uncultured Gemmatimonadaceae bacterium]